MLRIRIAPDGAFQFVDGEDFVVTSLPPGYVGKDARVISVNEFGDAMEEYVSQHKKFRQGSLVELIGTKPSKMEIVF